MNCFHPGGKQITDRAVELCGFKKNDHILDIGCGEGATMEYLMDIYGFDVSGCDLSCDMIKRATERNPSLEIHKCDGYSLSFPPSSFDGAYMECSFSLFSNHPQYLRALYNILKPGARLAVSDLYMVNHSPAAIDQSNQYRSTCLYEGVFLKDRLIKCLELTGFKLIAWEDKTQELKNYIAQILMDYGSFKNMWKTRLPEGADIKNYCNVSYNKNTGYFLLVAERAND